MKLVEQSVDAIKNYKERKIKLIKEIEKYLKEIASNLNGLSGRKLRISYRYPDHKENEVMPRLMLIELQHHSHGQTYFTFQFPTGNKFGKVGSDVIVENLADFPEKELITLLESFSLDEKREIIVEEI